MKIPPLHNLPAPEIKSTPWRQTHEIVVYATGDTPVLIPIRSIISVMYDRRRHELYSESEWEAGTPADWTWGPQGLRYQGQVLESAQLHFPQSKREATFNHLHCQEPPDFYFRRPDYGKPIRVDPERTQSGAVTSAIDRDGDEYWAVVSLGEGAEWAARIRGEFFDKPEYDPRDWYSFVEDPSTFVPID